MAVARVQAVAKGSAGAVASLSLTSGDGWATPTAGNVLVVFGNSDSTITMTTAGFTSGPSVVDGNGAYSWYKTAAGTESTITITPGGSSRTTISAIEISGAALPIDASNSSTIAGSSGLVTTAAAVSTTAAGDYIAGAALLHSYSTAPPTLTGWSNSFTSLLTASSTPTVGSSDVTTFVGELIAGASGSYSTVCTWSVQTAGDRQHIILAFKESAGGTAFTRTVDDPAGLTDTTSVASTFARTVTDAAGLVDSAAAVSAFTRTQTDVAGLTDSATAASAFVRTATDDVGLTDAVLVSSGPTRTVDDSVGLTDSLALARSVTVNDTAGLADTLALARSATVSDQVGLTDSVSVELAGAGARQVDDTIGLTDSLGISSMQTLTDVLGLVDTATLVLAAARDATDALGITDSVTVDRSAAVADAAGLTDSVTADLTTGGSQAVTITDSIGLTSAFRIVQTTYRPSSGVTDRPYAGVTPRYPLVPD